MLEKFDPYHRWLGIPPKHQPPDHYRLLGIEQFESEPEVIRDAVEQRMAHVRTYQLGPNSAVSQKILNELGAAKACLLDLQEKAAYDAALKANLDPVEAAISGEPPPESGIRAKTGKTIPVASAASELGLITRQSARPVPKGPRLRKGPSALGIVVASIAGLLAAAGAFLWIRGNTEDVGRKGPREQATVHRQGKSAVPANGATDSASQGSALNSGKKSLAKPTMSLPQDKGPAAPKFAPPTETKPATRVESASGEYKQALPGLAGLAKDKAEKRLQEITCAEEQKLGKGEPAILGKWTWKNTGEVVEFRDDGSCTTTFDPTTVGKWVCVEKKTQRYQIQWPKWGVSRAVMSLNGTTLSARDFAAPENASLPWNWTRNVNEIWTGKKIQLPGGENATGPVSATITIVGKWTWNPREQIVEFSNNGRVKGWRGNVGYWKKIHEGKYYIFWNGPSGTAHGRQDLVLEEGGETLTDPSHSFTAHRIKTEKTVPATEHRNDG